MTRRIVGGLALGALLSAAFEPVAFAYLAPVCVGALIVLVRDLPPRRAWLPGLAFGIGFQFVLLSWMRAVGTDAWTALAGVQASFYGPLGAYLAYVSGRWRAWPLLTAAGWVAVEVWRSGWPFSGMPWGRLAFAVVDTPFAPALAYVGANGVSFLLALLGSWLAWIVTDGRRRPVLAAAGLASVLLVSLLPAIRPYEHAADGSATVAVVQGNVPGDGRDVLLDTRQLTQNHVDATLQYAAQVRSGAVARPDFVLWPENSTAVDPFTNTGIETAIQGAVNAVGVPILVGGMVDAPNPMTVLNQGIVWEPGSGGADRYTKRHPVPFGEYIPWRDRIFKSNFGKLRLIPRDMASGTTAAPLRINAVRVADAICFDIAYDDGLRTQLLGGGELLTVQTSNAMFVYTPQIDQQFAITRLRAIETDRAVAVAATNGVTGLIGPDGRVLARAAPRTQRVLQAELPLSSVVTPGVWLGPWVARTMALLALLALVVGLTPYRRRQLPLGTSGEGRML